MKNEESGNEEIEEMKRSNRVAFGFGIRRPGRPNEEMKKRKPILQRYPRDGSDSSSSQNRPSAWLIEGPKRAREELKIRIFGGIRRAARIQAGGLSCGLRPLADQMPEAGGEKK
jgi:hypothetical protein